MIALGFKILTAEVSHETNTFSVLQTAEDNFRNRFFLRGETALKERGEANTELGGFLDVGRTHDWDVTHVLSVAAGPGGLVHKPAFDWFCDPIVGRASDGGFDGILLALHGAMVTDFCEDGEGELLRRIRKVVGPSLPIALTLDPHANVTQQMCDLAQIIVSFKTYPHIDKRDIGQQAAAILQRAMAGDIKPSTTMIRVPMLEEVNGGRTDIGPMIERLQKAREYETQDDVYAVSINAGFASADIEEVGPTILVTGSGDMEEHRSFAQNLADDIWARRNDVLNVYYPVDEAAAYALAHSTNESKRPLIIADYADNPGAGAYGDGTALLGAMLDRGLDNACFGPMVDSMSIEELNRHQIGSRVTLQLGGKTDPQYGGPPLEVDCQLISLWDGIFVGDGPMLGGLSDTFGATAVVRIQGIDVLVTTLARQMLDLQQFCAFGIDPRRYRTIGIKSMQHFRAAFEPIAGEIIVCDSGALCTPHYSRMQYKNVRRPIFPLDTFQE